MSLKQEKHIYMQITLRVKCITSTRRPIIYPSGEIIAHDKRYQIKGNFMGIKLEDIFKIHGNPIEEDNESEDFEIFAYTQALKYIRKELLEPTILKDANIHIQIFVVNNFEINAHSIKMDTSEYVIILKSGLVDFAMQTCGYDIDFLKEELKLLGDKNDVMGLWIYLTMLYFSGHEFGHIINGHLEFSKDNYMTDEKSTINIFNMKNLPSSLKSKPDIFYHLLELNADRLSVIFLSRGLLNLLIKYKQDYDKDTLESLIELITYNIYLTHYKFGFFDVKNEKYPTHFFRAYSILNDFPQVLNTLFKKDTHEKIQKTVDNAMYKIFEYLSDNDEDFLSEKNKKNIHNYNDNISSLYTKEQKDFNDFLKVYSMI